MPALTIKGIPEELLDALRRSAEANRRSLNAEVIHRLEKSVAVHEDREALLARIRERRERMGVWLTEESLRIAKDEGRP